MIKCTNAATKTWTVSITATDAARSSPRRRYRGGSLRLLPPRLRSSSRRSPLLKVATRTRRLRPRPGRKLRAAEVPKSEAPTGEIKPEAAPESAPSAPTAAAAGAPFKAKLSVVRGGRKGQEFPLEEGNNLVGRWDPETGSFPEVDLDADDPEAKISRKHALIRIEGGKITIEDIGSLNGTYVNRQPRLSPGSPAELKSGDEVIIGKTFLKLVVETIS